MLPAGTRSRNCSISFCHLHWQRGRGRGRGRDETRRDNGPAKTHSSIFAIPFRHLSSYTICCSIVLATVVVVVVVLAVIVVGVSSTARSLCAIIQLIPGNIIYETLGMFIAGNNHSFPAPSTCSPYIHTHICARVWVWVCVCAHAYKSALLRSVSLFQ